LKKNKKNPRKLSSDRAEMCHGKICELLYSCFEGEEDHKSIDTAMLNCPMKALLMVQG
jgi:hypothetical protein